MYQIKPIFGKKKEKYFKSKCYEKGVEPGKIISQKLRLFSMKHDKKFGN